METKIYKIGDFLHRIKRPVSLSPNKYYNLVTIKTRHKGVVLRGQKKGAEIKSQMYQVKEGDFILSGIDARNGAFGIVPKELDHAVVTNDFWYFDLDKEIIDKHFFLELTSTSWFDEICRLGSDGTTQRIRLQKDKFFNQEINLPELKEQKGFVSRFIDIKNLNSDLTNEIQTQKDLILKLKQAILQEAVEGKLTEGWRKGNPDIESASELLERIKQEKEELIEKGKIKKRKLSSVNFKKENIFKLPDRWAWCKIPQILALTNDPLRRGPFGSSLRKDMFEPKSKETTKVYEQQNAIKKDYALGHYYISTIKYPNLKSFLAGPGDILISCAGTIGETYKLPSEAPVGIINQALLKIKLNNSAILDDFFLIIFKSQLKVRVNSDAKGSTMKNIGSVKYLQNELIFGLPPIEEQKEIVKKVNNLMKRVSYLSGEIKRSEEGNKMLMQVVLKEAFSK